MPKPTDIAMHDIKNSTSLPQLARSLAFAVGWPLGAIVSAPGDDTVDTPFGCELNERDGMRQITNSIDNKQTKVENNAKQSV